MPSRLQRLFAIGIIFLLSVSIPNAFPGTQAQSQTNLLQNGDFSNGLADWTSVKVQTSEGVRGEYPIFEILTQNPKGNIDCTPSGRKGNPFLNIEVPFGANGYVEQQVTIPSSASTLSFVSWGNELSIGEVNAYVIVVDASGTQHTLETFTPPPILNPGGPTNPNGDTCTGNSPVVKSYDLSAYSGQTVKLRLGATSQNCCGTNAFFDDVDVEAQQLSPDFRISVSPTDLLVVHSGGWNTSISALLQSIDGFQGSISFGYSTPCVSTQCVDISVAFDPASVNLLPSSEVSVMMNVSAGPQLAPGIYQVGVIAFGNNQDHNVPFSVDVIAGLKPAVLKEKLVYDEVSIPPYQHGLPQEEPFLAINPAKPSNMIVAYNDHRFGVGISFTTDNGDSWTAHAFPNPYVCCDPWVAFQSDGTAFATAKAAEGRVAVDISRSIPDSNGNAGSVWQAPTIVGGASGCSYLGVSSCTDRPVIGIDNVVNRDPSTKPTEYIYVAWQIPANCDWLNHCTNTEHINRSTDNGISWDTPITLSSIPGASPGWVNDIALGRNGEVYVAWATNPVGTGTHVICKLNSPNNWPNFACSTPSVPPLQAPLAYSPFPSASCNFVTKPRVPNTCLRTNSGPRLAVDRNNNVYIVWQNWASPSNGPANGDILLSKAVDGNINSWSAPITVNNDNSFVDQFFPAVASDPISGNLLAVFYDRRDVTDRTSFNFYWAQSTDGGLSFPDNGRISSRSSNPAIFPDAYFLGVDVSKGGFLGDYVSVAPVPGSSGVFATVWTDLRDGTVAQPSQTYEVCSETYPPSCRIVRVDYPADGNSNIYFALIGPQAKATSPYQLEPPASAGIVSVGGTFDFNVSIPVTGHNVSDTVSLTIGSSPSGLVTTLFSREGTPPFESILNVKSTVDFPPGNYTLSIDATDTSGRNSTASMMFAVAPQPFVFLDRSSADPGQFVRFAGLGFRPLSIIQLHFDGETIATTNSDSGGGISGTFIVPKARDGLHAVEVIDEAGTSATIRLATPVPRVMGDESAPPPLHTDTFFTDPDLNKLPLDQSGIPSVSVVIAHGKVRSTNPGQVLAWVNMTNISSFSFQSLFLNETLPVDWRVSPSWQPSNGAIHVFFRFINGTTIDITDSTTILGQTVNPQEISVTLPNLATTAAGSGLEQGDSILVSVKLAYVLDGTTQPAATYPRNYSSNASATVFIQPNLIANSVQDSRSGFFKAYAKS